MDLNLIKFQSLEYQYDQLQNPISQKEKLSKLYINSNNTDKALDQISIRKYEYQIEQDLELTDVEIFKGEKGQNHQIRYYFMLLEYFLTHFQKFIKGLQLIYLVQTFTNLTSIQEYRLRLINNQSNLDKESIRLINKFNAKLSINLTQSQVYWDKQTSLKMEKQITLKNIHAKFEKDFDVFGKMDPFLIFKFANSQAKTTVAQGAGLQAKWDEEIKFTTVDQSEVVQIMAYDQDTTENEYIGTTYFNINKDQLPIKFVDINNNIIGQVSFTFTKKQSLKYDYTIKVWNISAEYNKGFDTFSTMEPFLIFSHEDQKFKTQIVQNVEVNKKISFQNSEFSFGFNKESQKELKLKRYKQLKIAGYQDDLTDQQYVGKVYIEFQQLSKEMNGNCQKKLNGQDGESIGKVEFSYLITSFQKSTVQQTPTRAVQQTLLGTVQQKRKSYPPNSLNPQKQDLPSTKIDTSKKQDTSKPDFRQNRINITNQVKIPPTRDDPKKTNPSNKDGPKQNKIKKQDIPQTQTYSSKQDPQKQGSQSNGISNPNQDDITQSINPQKQGDPNGGKGIQNEKVEPNHQPTSRSHSTITSGVIIDDGHRGIKVPIIKPVASPKPVKSPKKQIQFRILGLNIKDSAFTLQRSVKIISIGKEKRFRSTLKNTAETYRHDTCFQPNKEKGAGFGFGNKIQISAMTSRKNSQYPGPDSYFRELRTFSVHSKATVFAKQQRFDPKAVILKSLMRQSPNKINFRIKPARKTN